MHSFASAAMLNSQQALFKQAAGEQLGLALSVWAARDAWVQVSVSAVRSCKSETSDWRELKAWCSVPINSTVCCQRCSTGSSQLINSKEWFWWNRERCVGWIPIRVSSFLLGRKHLGDPSVTFSVSNSHRSCPAQGVKIVLSQKETKKLLICGLGHHLIVSLL